MKLNFHHLPSHHLAVKVAIVTAPVNPEKINTGGEEGIEVFLGEILEEDNTVEDLITVLRYQNQEQDITTSPVIQIPPDQGQQDLETDQYIIIIQGLPVQGPVQEVENTNQKRSTERKRRSLHHRQSISGQRVELVRDL